MIDSILRFSNLTGSTFPIMIVALALAIAGILFAVPGHSQSFPETPDPSALEKPDIMEPGWFEDMPRWVDIGLYGSWNVANRAYSEGPTPLHRLDVGTGTPLTLCDPDYVGHVAICRKGGWEEMPATLPTDIEGEPESWCVYKSEKLDVTMRFSGTVEPGRVFVCARVLKLDQ